MSLKKYLIVMGASNAGLWAAWVLIVFNLDPQESGRLALALFYVSLCLALAGTFALIGFFLRALAFRQTPIFRHLGVAHRQGFLLAVLTTGSLMLQAGKLFTWWSALLLLAIIIGIESLFVNRQPV